MKNDVKTSFGKKISAGFLATIMVLTSVSTLVFIAAPVKADDSTIWTTDEYGNAKTANISSGITIMEAGILNQEILHGSVGEWRKKARLSGVSLKFYFTKKILKCE